MNWRLYAVLIGVAGLIRLSTLDFDFGERKSATQSRSSVSRSELPDGPRGRLPNFYTNTVSLSQRHRIYEIQERYRKEIESREKKIRDLIEKCEGEVFNVLADEQRAIVDTYRKLAVRIRRERDRIQQRQSLHSPVRP